MKMKQVNMEKNALSQRPALHFKGSCPRATFEIMNCQNASSLAKDSCTHNYIKENASKYILPAKHQKKLPRLPVTPVFSSLGPNFRNNFSLRTACIDRSPRREYPPWKWGPPLVVAGCPPAWEKFSECFRWLEHAGRDQVWRYTRFVPRFGAPPARAAPGEVDGPGCGGELPPAVFGAGNHGPADGGTRRSFCYGST